MKHLIFVLALIGCEKTEPSSTPQGAIECETIIEIWPCNNRGICSAGTDKKMLVYDNKPFKIGQKICF
jgi:hypothetical protein